MDPLHRVALAQRAAAAGMAAGVLISWKLWVTTRLFPHFPVLDFVPQPPAPADFLLVALFLGVALGLVARPLNSALLRTFLAAGAVLLFLDQMRWQPWVWFYLLMTLPLACGPRAEPRLLLHLQRLVVAGLLFWGGAHKLGFLGSGFDALYEGYLAAPLLAAAGGTAREAVLLFGSLIPWLEMGIAAGLCWSRTRKGAPLLAVAMHAVILLMIVPREHTNVVVWPWNAAMILIVPALFFRGPALEWRQALGDSGRRLWPALFAVLALVMPATYYAGLWDRTLSFHLYTGRQQQLIVLLPAQRTLGLVPEVRRQFLESPQARGFRELNVDHWSDRELRVPLVSEDRILRRLMERWCAIGVPEGDLFFVLHHPWLRDRPDRRVTCGELQAGR